MCIIIYMYVRTTSLYSYLQIWTYSGTRTSQVCKRDVSQACKMLSHLQCTVGAYSLERQGVESLFRNEETFLDQYMGCIEQCTHVHTMQVEWIMTILQVSMQVPFFTVHKIDAMFYCSQIMMLKLRGHPPILMRRQDGEEPAPFSNTFSKVELSFHMHTAHLNQFSLCSLYRWLIYVSTPTHCTDLLLQNFCRCHFFE